MNVRKLAAAVGLGLGLSLAGGVTQGALLSFEDDDVDFVLRCTSPSGSTSCAAAGAVVNPTPVTSGSLQQGDILLSIVEIPVFVIDGVNAIPAGQELVGIAGVQLLSPVPAVVPIGTQLSFGAPSVGLNALIGLGAAPNPAVPGGGAGGPASIALWFNDTATFDLEINRAVNAATNCPTMIFCIDAATFGTLVQVDGFNIANALWTATTTAVGGADIGVIAGANNNGIVTTVNAGLGNIFNLLPVGNNTVGGIDALTGLACAAIGAGTCVQVTISATVTGGQGFLPGLGAFAHSDFDAQKRTIAVPEPGVLSLLGALLLAFGFARRERKA